MPRARPGTRTRILDVAETLFAEKGYDATSLRQLTSEAEVNLAAVHYHFGSKLALFQAVFERRVGPINEERLARLQALEEEAGEGPLPLESLLEAFLEPVLRRIRGQDPGFRRFVQLVGRANSATGDHLRAIRDVFRDVQARFFPRLQAALPHLGQDDLFWRLHFLLGAMCTLLADPQRVCIVSGGLCDSEDPEEVLRQLVTFAAAGLRAVPARVAAASRQEGA